MKMEQTECSEMLAYKIQMPENYAEESIQHSEHGKSFKSRMYKVYIKMEDALRSISCNKTCMYILLAYLMVAGNNELEIAEGESYGQIQCTVSAFLIMDRGILDKIMVWKVCDLPEF